MEINIKLSSVFGILTPSSSQLTIASSSLSTSARNNHRTPLESLPTNEVNEDRSTATSPADNVPCSQSVCRLPLSEDRTLDGIITKPDNQLAVNLIQERAPPSQCTCPPPSPAATEIENPESQDIVDQMRVKGIKIRDFAYGPPAPRLSPVPEIFDQFSGLAEVEYRWTQSHRTYAIQGRILSRLIDMGWIGQEELSSRAAPMDLEELRKHNARQPTYLWKPLCWMTIPTMEERKELMHARTPYFLQRDRARAAAELREWRKLTLGWETEEVKEQIRKSNKQKPKALSQAKGREVDTKGHKRLLEADDEDNDKMNTCDRESDIFLKGETEPKKRRRSKENVRPAFLNPPKQYPAPLHAYDPIFYPEVAYIIRSQPQPRPMVPQRADTPLSAISMTPNILPQEVQN